MNLDVESLRMKMAALEAALDQQLPDYRISLKEIHDALKEDPENETILSDEERGIIIRGLKVLKNEHIHQQAQKAAKKTNTVKASIKGKGEDDIMKMLGG